MGFQPVGNRIWIEIDEHGGKSPGGIIIPQKSAQITRKGTVKAVGQQYREIRFLFWLFRVKRKGLYQPGDRVLLSIYAGVNLHILEDGLSSMENIVCSEDEILGFAGE